MSSSPTSPDFAAVKLATADLPDSPDNIEDLLGRCDSIMLRDRDRLRRRIQQLQDRPQSNFPATRKSKGRQPDTFESLNAALIAAEVKLASRALSVPEITYPSLPVSLRRVEILDILKAAPVVIVAGETGSGKSTQLPKLLLEAGRGIKGMIGHTQPRRLAARTIAERVAEELNTTVGGTVGYAVRFTDRVTDNTLIKVMTDGILLAELQRDRDLLAYDAIIIDEAHERSLNIDFLLGYLSQLRTRRPDLQLVITSATIDAQRFAEHFATSGKPAPIIEVTGRTYPVEVRFQPFGDHAEANEGDDRDLPQAIADAVDELCKEGPGDILVFLSGEREINDTADALADSSAGRFDILPLYARLSSADQHRVFEPHRGRRVVLSTNVAETSLTVPGIRYVIDTGTARISRFSRRLKVQRLPIEPVSQASANQRSGRCGRVAPGIAIRLYGKEDFTSRPDFTEPEILRTNLASVLLQMSAIQLGDVAKFPFVDPPDRSAIRDGVALLEELGAFVPKESDADKRLTPLGRRLAQLPIDPRLGRMIIEANRLGCVREVLIIASALSIQDPRERPKEKQQQAQEFHHRFVDENSDFISWLNLWGYLKDQQRALTKNQFRKRCKTEHLNFLRIREWQDVHAQLRQTLNSVGISMTTEGAHHDHIHQALLAGLLSQLGYREEEKSPTNKKPVAKGKPEPKRLSRSEYIGAREARFAIAPGSALTKRNPAWIMAGELIETNRLWARSVAMIQPAWAEEIGAHLCQRNYAEPRWDAKQGAAVISENITLYGLPIVKNRRVQLSNFNPPLARELFIRHALVEHDWQTTHSFIEANQNACEALADLAARARRTDLVLDDDRMYELFDERVPADVVSARHFDRWWKTMRRETPDLLTFRVEQVQRAGAPPVSLSDFPDMWIQGDQSFPVSYRHQPGSPADGVTIHLTLPALERVRTYDFEWHVPGFRAELVASLVRSLPKDVRRELGPAPEVVPQILERCAPFDRPLIDSLVDAVTWLSGLEVRRGDIMLDALPAYLRLMFSIESRHAENADKPIASGTDLAALRDRLRPKTRVAVGAMFPNIEQVGQNTWTFGDISQIVSTQIDGAVVNGYPALTDEKTSVGIKVFTTKAAQQRSMAQGTRRLLLLTGSLPMKQLLRAVGSTPHLALALDRHGTMSGLLDDCMAAALDLLVVHHGGPAWTTKDFTKLKEDVRSKLLDTALGIGQSAGRIYNAAGRIEVQLSDLTNGSCIAATRDIGIQVDRLVHQGFVAISGPARLPDIERYLKAVERRIEQLPAGVAKDRERLSVVARLEQQYETLLLTLKPEAITAAVGDVRWMIEELRVSLFAQQLGTNGPASEVRIRRSLEELWPAN
jgi:ATP-dependent helicase HrpA